MKIAFPPALVLIIIAALNNLAHREVFAQQTRLSNTISYVTLSSKFQSRSAEMKRKFEQRRRQMRREFEQRKKEMQRDWERKRKQQDTVAPGPSQRSLGRLETTETAAPPFNRATAPDPTVCLQRFIQAAQSGSINSLIAFLPTAERNVLRQRQASYDRSQVASKEDWFKKHNPQLTVEDLNVLTDSPYNHARRRYRRIAEKIIAVRKVKIEGDRAIISVSTKSDAVVDGERYPFGTATVEMVGEGNFWRFSKYNDSNVVYKYSPK